MQSQIKKITNYRLNQNTDQMINSSHTLSEIITSECLLNLKTETNIKEFTYLTGPLFLKKFSEDIQKTIKLLDQTVVQNLCIVLLLFVNLVISIDEQYDLYTLIKSDLIPMYTKSCIFTEWQQSQSSHVRLTRVCLYLNKIHGILNVQIIDIIAHIINWTSIRKLDEFLIKKEFSNQRYQDQYINFIFKLFYKNLISNLFSKRINSHSKSVQKDLKKLRNSFEDRENDLKENHNTNKNMNKYHLNNDVDECHVPPIGYRMNSPQQTMHEYGRANKKMEI